MRVPSVVTLSAHELGQGGAGVCSRVLGVRLDPPISIGATPYYGYYQPQNFLPVFGGGWGVVAGQRRGGLVSYLVESEYAAELNLSYHQ